MAVRRLSRSHLAQLQPAAARSLATAPFLHDTADLPRSRDRETADEETFERPFYCIKSNALPPWPRKTGQSDTRALLHCAVVPQPADGRYILWFHARSYSPACLHCMCLMGNRLVKVTLPKQA